MILCKHCRQKIKKARLTAFEGWFAPPRYTYLKGMCENVTIVAKERQDD